MKSRIYCPLATVLLCLVFADLAWAQKGDEPLRVGVVVVASINIDQATSLDISDALGTALEQTLHIEAVAGGKATARLSKEILDILADDCMVNKSCIRAVGAALGVQELLFLVVVRVANQVQVNATWADVESAATKSRERISLSRSVVDERSPELRQAFVKAATSLVPNAKPKPATAPDPVEPIRGNSDTPVLPPPDQGGTTPGGQAPGAGATTGTDTGASGGRKIPMGTWIAGGISVAALAGGIGYGISAVSYRNDLNDTCKGNNSCTPEQVDTLESKVNRADILYGISAVAAITAGVIYYLAKDERDSNTPVAIEPTLGSGSAGILVHGRF